MKLKLKNFQKAILLKLLRRRRYKYPVPRSRYPLRRYRQQEGGFVMVVVIVMILILTSLFAAYSLLTKTDASSAKASTSSNTGFYAAEAGLNMRAKQVQDKFVGFNRPQGSSPDSWENCLNQTGNQGSGDFACDKRTFNGQDLLTYVKEDSNNPNSITINSGEPFAGLTSQEYRYDVTSVAVNSQNLPTAIEGMRFKSRLVPLFQFLMFYKNDLDFSVPPTMNLNGPIHTNGDLYFDAGSGNTLTINGQISTAGTLYRGEKYINSCTGIVNIYNSSTPSPLNCNSSSRKSYNQSAVSSWNNTIRVGINPLTIPTPGDLDPTPGKLYWDKADLRVVLKIDPATNIPSIEVRNQSNAIDSTTTNNLRSCSTNPLVSTTLRDKAAGNPNYIGTDTVLKVASAAGFQAGDVVIVGTDYDSNVIAPGGVNTATIPNTITLKRQLGHNYQTGTIASTSNTVRKAIVSTSNTFYNYREKQGVSGGAAGSYIRMLNVDVQGLLNCIQTSVNNSASLMGLNPDNTQKGLNETSDGGLVLFLTVDGSNATTDVTQGGSSNTYGIRLYNGEYLYSNLSGAPEIQGLTVASDQAVYIQGDYNMKDDPATPLVNEGDDLTTAGITERWRPAAILADTINVLSNAWIMDDSNNRTYSLITNLPTSQVLYTNAARTPLPTRINAAFLSGTEITGGVNGTAGQDQGQNSGGVNNYPRFHENWASTVPLFYKGSFISLNRPRRVNSPFCGSADATNCNIYTPPVRNWDYDTAFNNAANLPPLTPRMVYLRQEVFSRNFDR